MSTQKYTKSQKAPITKERFSAFHIEKHQLNKACGEILTEVDCLAKTYRHNKHNNKDISSVCLFDKDWKKLISSLNVYAKKELRKIIETDCLIYQGIKLRPKNISADN